VRPGASGHHDKCLVQCWLLRYGKHVTGHVTIRHSTIADILVCGTDGTICDTLEALIVTRTKNAETSLLGNSKHTQSSTMHVHCRQSTPHRARVIIDYFHACENERR